MGAPQGDPCEGNPCGVNNICTANGGAVSCECAPGNWFIPYQIPYSAAIMIILTWHFEIIYLRF